jgi:hypothetical protein
VLQHNGYVECASFSPDGSRIVTGTKTKSVSFLPRNSLLTQGAAAAQMWDAFSGTPVGPPMKHDGDVESAIFSRDGTRILTAGNDNTARVWNAQSGLPVGQPIHHRQPVTAAGFSPDGTRIITSCGGDTSVRIWHTESRQPALVLEEEFVSTSAAYSPDGTRIVTGSTATARLWDANTGLRIGGPLSRLAHLEDVNFSSDGSFLVTAGGDGTARVRDIGSREPLGRDVAERFAAACAGARLDPELGTLRTVTGEARLALWKELSPAMEAAPDWRFAAEAAFPRDPESARVSPHSAMTIREAATALLRTTHRDSIRETAEIDPAHPLIPFGYARIASEDYAGVAPNPARAAWLIAYGMKRLPADMNAADLRLAARLVAFAAKLMPGKKATALSLLDRAAKFAPEDEDTKALRAELQ